MARNAAISETDLVSLVTSRLRERLPAAWKMELNNPPPGRIRPDAYLRLSSPGGQTATIAIETITASTAPYLRYVLEIQRRVGSEMPEAALLAAAPYFSPGIRNQLVRNGIGYADATGNFRLALAEPAVFIETTGADKDPWPDDLPLRSLKGRGAGRGVRAFCDFTPPYGIRELATRSETPAPTLSRVAALLEGEALLTRERPRGKIAGVDWQGALRRWALDYTFNGTNRTGAYLEPRGLETLLQKLRESSRRYALTGSFAASVVAPITAPRLAAVYVDTIGEAAKELHLRPAETGANVLLVEPYDPVVFQRGFERDELQYTACTQLVVDLLTGPGRSPAEGEALIEWMAANEPEWRA